MEKSLGKLFISSLTLSAFTFGGGYVIVPLMKKKFVDELHWIDEKKMLDLVAISQSAPGPIAVNASILVGYELWKIKGALVSIVGTVLPPLVILTIISNFYVAFSQNIVIAAALRGMQAGIAAVIVDVVINMASTIIQSKKAMYILIMVISFVAAALFHVNVVLVLFFAAIAGAAYQHDEEQAKKERYSHDLS